MGCQIYEVKESSIKQLINSWGWSVWFTDAVWLAALSTADWKYLGISCCLESSPCQSPC